MGTGWSDSSSLGAGPRWGPQYPFSGSPRFSPPSPGRPNPQPGLCHGGETKWMKHAGRTCGHRPQASDALKVAPQTEERGPGGGRGPPASESLLCPQPHHNSHWLQSLGFP